MGDWENIFTSEKNIPLEIFSKSNSDNKHIYGCKLIFCILLEIFFYRLVSFYKH